MKKLYVVTIQTQVLVVADSPADAKRLAETERDISWDADRDSLSIGASEMTHMPAEWDDDCIPYGDIDKKAPNRTVGEWIAAGAAPVYSAALEAALARDARRKAISKP